MPTNKPRVQVTLEPFTHSVIDRLAKLQGRSRGAVIADLLDSVAPSLTRTISLIEAAQEAPDQVKQGLRRAVEHAHSELVLLSGDASKQLDVFLADLGSDDEVNPHVVTRGSGTNPPTTRKPSKTPSKRSRPGDTANG